MPKENTRNMMLRVVLQATGTQARSARSVRHMRRLGAAFEQKEQRLSVRLRCAAAVAQ